MINARSRHRNADRFPQNLYFKLTGDEKSEVINEFAKALNAHVTVGGLQVYDIQPS